MKEVEPGYKSRQPLKRKRRDLLVDCLLYFLCIDSYYNYSLQLRKLKSLQLLSDKAGL